ncbi:alanine racemase [Asticcacaulis sp. 201]|uniref:alanine racemase n=1 Tax=Asticcacaulis sp. 201 TaxID=3028787 RepID=UPI002915DC7F|nr:alanine racemase [Asticcacaulis sp. 201]MDV6330640.1 alanine racemase [Asticcacaulis sp. 201]
MLATAKSRALALGMGGVLTIDLAAVAANYRRIQAQAPTAQVSAVVKADAYGLGVEPVSHTLYDAGCRLFFVAHASEALMLRQELPGDADLCVLNGLLPGAEAACANADIIPVLNAPDQIERWATEGVARGRKLPAILQFDTGMSRLGLSPADSARLNPDALKARFDLRFLMSHLACADEPANSANDRQLAVMHDIAARFGDIPVSFANSGGTFLGPAYQPSIIRPGIALYGGAPHVGVANPMTPVVRLDVAVIQTRSVPAGTQIGYGGTFTATQEMRLATIAAGYADGLPRGLSNRGAAWLDGVRLPIVGRVSMDSIIIDISALPADALAPGDLVELMGPHQSIDAIAADAGTISYEILTALGRRYYRDYLRAT